MFELEPGLTLNLTLPDSNLVWDTAGCQWNTFLEFYAYLNYISTFHTGRDSNNVHQYNSYGSMASLFSSSLENGPTLLITWGILLLRGHSHWLVHLFSFFGLFRWVRSCARRTTLLWKKLHKILDVGWEWFPKDESHFGFISLYMFLINLVWPLEGLALRSC